MAAFGRLVTCHQQTLPTIPMTPAHHVTAALQAAVAEEVSPGAVLHVRVGGRVVFQEAVGRLTYAGDAPAVTPATIYDLASLTKPLATATLALQLIASQRLHLSQPIGELLGELRQAAVGRATVEQVLAHAAGLPAWRPYYERLTQERGTLAGSWPRAWAQDRVLNWIAAEALEAPPGARSVYSDLGFILLGIIIERTTQQPLDAVWRADFAKPLEARPLDFVPSFSTCSAVFGSDTLVAPTEQDAWRGRLVVGEVHDENAAALGGVAGHAGLFGTADAVSRVGQWWLDVRQGRRQAELQTLAQRFTARVTTVEGSTRALGWDTPSEPSSSGRFFSPQSFGHLGFAGTSLWIDPQAELVVVLLTNRVHPTRANNRIKAFRPRVHDLVYETWVKRR